MAKPVPGSTAGRGRPVAEASNPSGAGARKIAGAKVATPAGRGDGGPSAVTNGVRSSIGLR